MLFKLISTPPPALLKKLFKALAMALLTANLNAQSQNWWRVNGNTPSSSDFLGTTNNTPIIFKTNNISRFRIDANGDIASTNFIGTTNRLLFVNANGTILPFTMGSNTQVLYGNGTWGNLPIAATTFTNNGADLVLPTNTKLGIGVNAPTEALDVSGNFKISGNIKSSSLAGNGLGLVYADSLGNLFKPQAPNPGNPPAGINAPCIPSSLPWFNGGNYVNSTGLNEAGTCNAIDFVLKSNNVLSQWIKPSGSIGFGANFTSNVGDPLQFIFSNGMVRTTGNNAFGGPMFLFDGPTSPNGDWGIEYTGGTGAPQAGLNFWKPFGSTNANNNILFLHDNNNIGIATDNPTARLTIESWANDGIKMTTDNLNSKALSLNYKDLSNGNVREYFSVNANGYTDIKVYSPLAMPKPYGAPTNERVFTVRDVSGNKDLFAITSKGLVYAREVEINLIGTFPDFVFENNYKLKPLSEVDAFIKANKHLPNFEKGTYYEKNGINVTDLLLKQQQTIEELMLYNIELEKKSVEMQKQNAEILKRLNALEEKK